MQERDLVPEISQASLLPPDRMTVRNILLATDFSECSKHALSYALGIASRYESRLYLFHRIDPTPYNFVEPGAVQTACDDARRELEQLVSDLHSRGGANPQMMYKVPMVLQAEVRAILELAPLERFVFVMSVLERFSDHDCSILLGLARRDVGAARVRAMQRLVTLFDLEHSRRTDSDPETVIELTVAQHFATPEWTRSLSQ